MPASQGATNPHGRTRAGAHAPQQLQMHAPERRPGHTLRCLINVPEQEPRTSADCRPICAQLGMETPQDGRARLELGRNWSSRPKSGPMQAQSGKLGLCHLPRSRPKLRQTRPKSPKIGLGSAKCRPVSTGAGQNSAKSSRHRPNSTLQPKLVRERPRPVRSN